MKRPSLISETTILVLDDDRSFLDLFKMIFQKMKVKKLFLAQNAKEAYHLLSNESIDLCMLDIDLKDRQNNGITVGEHIRKNVSPIIPIIFITNHYDKSTFDKVKYLKPSFFLNKELSHFKLLQAVELTLINQQDGKKQDLDSPQEVIPTPETAPLIKDNVYFFKVGDAYKPFEIDQIGYFFSKNRLTYARLNQRNFPTTVQLKILERELQHNFVRIHKSYLVNINMISQINTKDDFVEVIGDQLPIGYAYRKNFFNRINLLK